MPKLHELLAVDTQLKGQASAATKDLMNTFEKKAHSHFSEVTVTVKSIAENVEPVTEKSQKLQTTVRKEIAWISGILAKSIDAAYQIDVANLSAKADITLDNGHKIAIGIPATALLALEHQLKDLKSFVMAIPTLDPAKGFEADPNMTTKESGTVYKAQDVEKPTTEKVFNYIVMVQPTDKFPAQVKELMIDKKIGSKLQQEWSGLITTAEKGDMIDRVEALARAVKQARSRANEIEIDVKTNKIAESLLKFVFDGK